MFSTFFINRPIFATVLSILIVIAGLVSLRGLPVEQYPTITPPTVVVRASYPGANASTIADMVGTPDRATSERRRGYAFICRRLRRAQAATS